MDEKLLWKELSREPAFELGTRKIDKVLFQFPDGRTDSFFLRRDGHSAVVVAFTPEDNIILIRQFRPGKIASL